MFFLHTSCQRKELLGGLSSAKEHRLISERVWNKLQRKLGRCGEENIFVKLGNSQHHLVCVVAASSFRLALPSAWASMTA